MATIMEKLKIPKTYKATGPTEKEVDAKRELVVAKLREAEGLAREHEEALSAYQAATAELAVLTDETRLPTLRAERQKQQELADPLPVRWRRAAEELREVYTAYSDAYVRFHSERNLAKMAETEAIEQEFYAIRDEFQARNGAALGLAADSRAAAQAFREARDGLEVAALEAVPEIVGQALSGDRNYLLPAPAPMELFQHPGYARDIRAQARQQARAIPGMINDHLPSAAVLEP